MIQYKKVIKKQSNPPLRKDYSKQIGCAKRLPSHQAVNSKPSPNKIHKFATKEPYRDKAYKNVGSLISIHYKPQFHPAINTLFLNIINIFQINGTHLAKQRETTAPEDRLEHLTPGKNYEH
jgi:hypothetical protein